MNSPTMQPTTPQMPMAGLGALAQPAQQPAGKSPESMGQIMALAKGMSDAELADVLSGKSLDIPQFAAMTEAMGRKSLRTALDGAQAQAELNKPTVKQQALGYLEGQTNPAPMQMAQAPQAGIDQLPARNMESMNMAAGGIVAFEEGGTAKERRESALKAVEKALPEPTMPDDFKGTMTEYLASPEVQKAAKEREIALDAVRRNNPIYAQPTILQNAPVGSAFSPVPTKTAAPAAAPTTDNTAPSPATTDAKPDSLGRFKAGTESATKAAGLPAVVNANQNAGTPVQPQGLDNSYEAAQARARAAADEHYAGLAKYGQEMRDRISSVKNQGQGEGLMNLAAAVMGSPNMAMAMSKGLPLLASTASSIRKETSDITKAANEYDFNMAKAKEAAASGDMKAYNDYMQNADMAKYHAMMGKAALMNASATSNAPENRMNIAIGNKVMDDVQKRLKDDIRFKNEWSKMSPDQQAAYYQQQYNIAQGVYSGKMNPAVFGGADLSSAAQAELDRRSKK